MNRWRFRLEVIKSLRRRGISEKEFAALFSDEEQVRSLAEALADEVEDRVIFRSRGKVYHRDTLEKCINEIIESDGKLNVNKLAAKLAVNVGTLRRFLPKSGLA